MVGKKDLRQQAEASTRQQAPLSQEGLAALSSDEIRRMLHELQVHQVELEMQNEELRRAQEELDGARARYFDLYDLAPVGYCTLGKQGLILEANLTAATLLGTTRGALARQPLTGFILREDQDLYYLHRKQLFDTGEPQAFELRMLKKEGSAFWAYLKATIAQDSDGATVCRLVLNDITERKFREDERELTARLILRLNTQGDFRKCIADLTEALQGWSGCEAVGIRLRSGNDYPYFETRGFPATFVQLETHLCAYGRNGELLRDPAGNPVLECMCGNILCGRFDPTQPFFSEHGSFWSNGTTALLAGTTEADRQAHTRNRCNAEGYESVALVPLRSGAQVFGLLQFNDHRPNRFTPEWIAQSERMADSLALALARRQAEDALRESNELLSLFIRQSPVFTFIKVVTPTESRVLEASENFQKMIGIPGSAMIGKTMAELFPAELARTMTADDWAVISSGKMLEVAEELNGRSYTSMKYPIIQEGKALLAGFTLDITDRVRAEKALQESEAEYQRLVHDMAVGVLVQGPRAEILLSNPRALELLGLTESQLLGMTSFDPAWNVIHEDGSPFPGPTHPVPRAIATRQPVHDVVMGVYRPATRDRVWLAVNAEPQLNENGTVRQVVCTFINITERKEGEAEKAVLHSQVQQEQLLSESILESLPGIFYLYTYPGLRLVRWNHRLESLFGYEPGEIAGRHLTEWYPPETRSRALAAIDEVMERGEGTLEACVLTKDGHLIPFLFTAIPFESQGQRFLMGTGTDLTERNLAAERQRHLEAQLQQAQKMESLGSLAGGVAHDMNNVLGAILGLASASIESQPQGSPIHKALGTIITAAERGGKMVKSLLSFARQSPAEERELDLNEIIREEVRLLERTTFARVHLEMDLATGLRPMRGDAGALTHAFMNLCVNAVDAMPGEGTLTLRTRNVNGDWIEVQVEDTGTGMPAEVLERALDPYFTTKEVGKGTGLGLSMVYSTVKAHHGQMEIQSEPGKGTRVRLRFPTCEGATRPLEPQVLTSSEPSKGELQVLLVDDDELIQSSIQAILGVLGHRTIPAFCGEEALTILEAGLKADVVILDMNMPGLGGAGTLPRLRALCPTVPILLATGRTDQAALDLIGTYPFVTLLSKPFTMGELKQQLERVEGAH